MNNVVTNTSPLSPLALTMQNLGPGGTLLPNLGVVQSVMSQLFGVGRLSTFPTSVAALAGTWNVISRNGMGGSNSYLSVIPMQSNPTNDVVTNTNGSMLYGYLSVIAPQNFIIYTPFPTTSVSNMALLPVAAAGIALTPTPSRW